jgi:hypothetical protein
MIKKPRGRPTTEQAEAFDLLERKRKMMNALYEKAELLMEKNTTEARQCLTAAQTLEQDIEKLERQLNPEQEEEKKETPVTAYEPRKETIFKPMWLDEETGEMKPIEEPVLKRRKMAGK